MIVLVFAYLDLKCMLKSVIEMFLSLSDGIEVREDCGFSSLYGVVLALIFGFGFSAVAI